MLLLAPGLMLHLSDPTELALFDIDGRGSTRPHTVHRRSSHRCARTRRRGHTRGSRTGEHALDDVDDAIRVGPTAAGGRRTGAVTAALRAAIILLGVMLTGETRDGPARARPPRT
jgi:hypothetical protein